MQTRIRTWFVPALLAAGAAGAALALRSTATAQDEGVVAAHFVGADSSKGATPELVLFNLTPTQMTLTLTLVDPEGTPVVHRVGEIELGSRQTKTVDLLEQFSRDLPRGQKPYAGRFAVVVRGAAPFDESTVVAHLAQYYGKRKKPSAAYVLRPVFLRE
jgi:hypothetical protein